MLNLHTEEFPMKILVTGYNGQLGYDVIRKIPSADECRGVDLQDFDITDKTQTMEYIRSLLCAVGFN